MKMQRLTKNVVGFTLIELMIVIAIIGILAAIAIPQYQRYAVRSSATQTINAIRPFQLSMAEYAIVNQRFPADPTDLPGIQGDDPIDTCSGIVSQVDYQQINDTSARLVVSFYADAADNVPAECNDGANDGTVTIPEQLDAEAISFLANINNNGVVTWTVEPNGANTTVADEYLPTL